MTRDDADRCARLLLVVGAEVGLDPERSRFLSDRVADMEESLPFWPREVIFMYAVTSFARQADTPMGGIMRGCIRSFLESVADDWGRDIGDVGGPAVGSPDFEMN